MKDNLKKEIMLLLIQDFSKLNREEQIQKRQTKMAAHPYTWLALRLTTIWSKFS